jgi:L-seryl-tRNA(Ser) seleniumtransferase
LLKLEALNCILNNSVLLEQWDFGIMEKKSSRTDMLKSLPGIDRMLEQTKASPFFKDIPRTVQVASIRTVIDGLRSDILGKDKTVSKETLSEANILEMVQSQAAASMSPNLKPLINATGVIVHTNLGRSNLAAQALKNLQIIGGGYSNLEFNLNSGKRGSRYSHVEDIICEVSGAEAAMVVNNNAGAVLLCLETLARGRQVIVSRGELVEIGGSFRVPDVMAKSGARLKEVGTTNRTHLRDYEGAIDSDTGLLLKVHTSNYSVVGFTANVALDELVALGKKHHVPVMEDLGSGTFVDFSKYGLTKEPTVQESIRSGVDVVSFSGDKLLGGPQAGIITGSKGVIDKIKQNPLTRALRIDKLTLAALESTLKLYRDEDMATESIPTLRMMLMPIQVIKVKADQLEERLGRVNELRLKIRQFDSVSRVGGGSLPLLSLPSKCVGIQVEGMSANSLDRLLRVGDPSIVGRIEDDVFMMDVRTIQAEEIESIAGALESLLQDN